MDNILKRASESYKVPTYANTGLNILEKLYFFVVLVDQTYRNNAHCEINQNIS